jgi:hypothetical protein
MRRRISLFTVTLVSITLVWTRLDYSELRGWSPMKVTQWDALGYYQYLPAAFIYHDIKRQDWLGPIDSIYHVVGTGGLYQVMELDNGNRATKYLCGVAEMQIPFFLIGHLSAKMLGFPQDGFSPPYQWAIAFSALTYCILALFLLRLVLKRYFSDATVALTLLLLVLATNAIQYISVDNGQSHGYLFALYALVLWADIKWHEAPRIRYAALIGAVVGLATVARPTEAIMLFIPLLWNTGSKAEAEVKWAQVRTHRTHIAWAVGAAFLMVLPQLVYWKFVTGSWVFDVGSKWDFLLPHFRVLLGGEKGWFIYTPITVFFIAGLFLMRGRPWRKSVIAFTLFNLWIVIAWHDWRYGGSYSARALVQSYPVLALPFAALVERALAARWKYIFIPLCAYLLAVNLFQIKQYNDGVLHYDRMNFAYYRAIYLDPHVTDEDRKLMGPVRH